MWPNPQKTADLVTFTEEILNGIFSFSVQCGQVFLIQTNYTCFYFLWRRSLSYRNKSIGLLCKSIDSFLYDKDFCHESVTLNDYQH